MVVHQNITNLAGYFHFLNVRKIPYVIIGEWHKHGNQVANSRQWYLQKVYFLIG